MSYITEPMRVNDQSVKIHIIFGCTPIYEELREGIKRAIENHTRKHPNCRGANCIEVSEYNWDRLKDDFGINELGGLYFCGIRICKHCAIPNSLVIIHFNEPESAERKDYYICSARGNGKSYYMEEVFKYINENSTYGLALPESELKYAKADVDATVSLWKEFCGKGGYTKSHVIDHVIFHDPATIVYWTDGTKTVVKLQKGDKKFDPEKGLAMAYVKHELGLKAFNKLMKEAKS